MQTTDHEITNIEKMRGFRWAVIFSVFNSIYSQYFFFGSVFVLFLAELGLDKAQIGGLLSLLPFFGLIALFVAGPLVRFGYKRTFLVTFGSRTVISGFLLLTPWVLAQWGKQAVIAFIVAIVAGFAATRAIGITGWYPWEQEYVPPAVRGKFVALKNSLSNLTGFIAVTVGGIVIGSAAGLQPFMILFAVGLFFGVLSLFAMARVPGGAPVRSESSEIPFLRQMATTLQDKSFVGFMIGGGLIILATRPLASFLPLFMKEQVGLSTGNVVLLQNGTLLGGLIFSNLWGWAADRYGSKPVMLTGVYLMCVLPLLWFLIPRNQPYSLHLALAVGLLQGVVDTSWLVGSSRLLFVSVVPNERRAEYMAVYFAWTGIVGGLSQLLGGRLLKFSSGLSGQWFIFPLDPYTLLFAIGLALPVISIVFFRSVRADSTVSTGEFAGMFFRGNPLLAMGSLIGFHRAKSERATVSMTERLGQAKSPLAVDELMEALQDPRFFVRMEAVMAIARGGGDPRLTDALIDQLQGHEPALSVIAAWALGRMGDERALEALRAGLESPYRSVQAHCARSLGTLNDQQVRHILLQRLDKEKDNGLGIAYAAALGKLGAQEAAGQILSLLAASRDPVVQHELALALARLLGAEHQFIQLLRDLQADPGTASAQALAAMRARLPEPALAELEACSEAFAQEEIEQGISLLLALVDQLERPDSAATVGLLFDDCMQQLRASGFERIEYLALMLLALDQHLT